MKKLWLVLLSLGLIMAFSVSAFAVDVKVSGEYFAAGTYLNKTSVNNGFEWGTMPSGPDPTPANPSTAFFYQRLRVGTDFVVAPSLKLVTRFTAMERIWGGARSSASGSYPDYMVTAESDGTAGTRAEAENIAFDLAYIDYVSPIGLFRVGYMPDYVWGTAFGDRANGMPSGQILYAAKKGAFTFIFDYAKEKDNSYNAVNAGSIISTRTDRDNDSYRIAGIFDFKGGEAGALFLYNREAGHRGWATVNSYPLYILAPMPYLSNIFVIDPYVKAKIGPVTLQAEAQYWFGDVAKFEYDSHPSNMSLSALSIFIDATANFGMFYAGGSFAYLSGDDPGTTDKVEGAINTAGLDWNPCLILFNTNLNYWAGDIGGHGYNFGPVAIGSVVDSEMSNAWFFQARVGVKPTPQWDIAASLSYAMADKKPGVFLGYAFTGGTYGTEVDVTATYKITNNLTYMLGAGYLFTGDYFKGFEGLIPQAKVNDDFIITNKLTLSF